MSSLVVPAGFKLHCENNTYVLLGENDAFLNPVQEFNRDLSVACIRTWSHETSKQDDTTMSRRGGKRKKLNVESPSLEQNQPSTTPRNITVLEPLSATGLRAIRYAKEIPSITQVIANDLSPEAVKAIERNAAYNEISTDTGPGDRLKINQGDACTLMYSHREISNRVDVIDLDPYGTASPFIDAAVQAVKDGGLLCITCTDLAVLATTNYPEKCFSNYGGIPMKTEYCHEAALRLVLHTVSTSASRYGRYIVPFLSLSIDFYVRLFIQIRTSPLEVKRAFMKTSSYYVCTFCQTPHEQPLGKIAEKKHEPSGNINYLYKPQNGPPAERRCQECGSSLQMAGPMWSGALHDREFVEKVLEEVELNGGNYGTAARMKGMLTVANEELINPFYFTPGKLSSFFHCNTPSLEDITSALLHAGFGVSRSHACPGSLKTNATRKDLHDIMRSWIDKHPVRMDRLAENCPTRTLFSKEPNLHANFEHHPGAAFLSSKVKLVRYQEPPKNWGPGKKASGSKRKRDQNHNDS